MITLTLAVITHDRHQHLGMGADVGLLGVIVFVSYRKRKSSVVTSQLIHAERLGVQRNCL
jgi:hypothetical protein